MSSDRPINHSVNFPDHSGQRDRVSQLLLTVIHREIESRLNQALHHRIYPRTMDRKNQFMDMEIPWAIHQNKGDRPELNLSEYTNIEAVFAHQEIQGRLGICGVPGSGKTTLILKLAQGLVNQAMYNPESPLPILLDVSSWQNNQQAIAPWIISILQLKYHLDRQTAKQLLKPHQVILLCDGLDELDESTKNKFISKFNQFLLDYWSGKIVIVGGTTPHLMQLSIVNIETYIELLPLTNNSVYRYLFQSDCEYLWEAIQSDADLIQIAQIPLFLNLIILSATEINLREWQLGKNRAEKLSYLWDAYIRNGLKCQGYFSHTSKDDGDKNLVRWFAWLAQKSLKHHQPEFSDLANIWLENPLDKIAFSLIIGLIYGLISGVIFWLIFSGSFGFIFGATLGAIVGAIAGNFMSYLIPPKPAFHFSKDTLIIATVGTLLSAVICGVIAGSIFWPILGQDSGLIYGSLFAVNGGLIFALVTLFTGGFSSTESQLIYQLQGGDRTPKEWLKNLFPYCTISLPMGIFWLWILWVLQGKIFLGWQLLIGGIIIGGLLAIVLGGLAEIHQFSLHLTLWFKGYIPWNYRQLLNYGKSCLFLHRVKGISGGNQRSYSAVAYRFIHPLFCQHLAQKTILHKRS